MPLDISFRAAEPLLQAVDAVFRQVEAADGVALDGAPIRHVAAYPGHAGLVELWPPVPADADERCSGGGGGAGRRAAPLEPRTRLARAIAATIAGWLDRGERLEPRGRALQAGDVIVLVRRRNEFVGDLLRALKTRGVPVAGADRLALAGELAVQDLIALGHFLLLPEDDLTLATVLKGAAVRPVGGRSVPSSPMIAATTGCGPACAASRASVRRCARPMNVLRAWLARADFVPPFELYADILGTGPGTNNGRRAILERLGAEAADPVEEFLALALAYEREHVPSLQGFLRWIASGDIEVKRDFGERQRDELRILTVHGAKGLEAPVVFLPDTVQLPDRRSGVLWSDAPVASGGCRCGARAPNWPPRPMSGRGEALRLRHLQEYRRLLYVALTRAQNRLYVCGWQNQKPTREAPCWHALCQSGWAGLADTVPFDTRSLIGERHGWTGEGLRLSSSQSAPPRRDERVAGMRVSGTPPSWVSAPPPSEPSPPKPLAPSRPSGRSRQPCRRSRWTGATASSAVCWCIGCCRACPNCPKPERERGRAGVSRPAGACADPGGTGRNPRRDDGGADRSRSRRTVGAGIAGRGAGRRADLRRYLWRIGRVCRVRSTASVVTESACWWSISRRCGRSRRAKKRCRRSICGSLRCIAPRSPASIRDRPIECALLWTDGPRS